MQDAYELAAKIFQFHCKTNILHSVFTLKSRIEDYFSGYRSDWVVLLSWSIFFDHRCKCLNNIITNQW
ncbi:MAG: hypothetical protein OFPII_39040 [Osedax symbiont Rs1]|nr:MAG: hypothetical protein OFPII_39040 [Osedax symbiont Rs1]